MTLRQIRHKRISRCIFCPNPPDTKEHAWEDWAVKRIQIGPIIIDGHIEGEPVLVPGQKAIRIKCLCEKCNEVWLKEIVDASLPFLSAMAQDISITLDPPQQYTVAQWALTRAMVWEFCSKDNRPLFYQDSQRRSLRESSQIPPNTTIWLSRYIGETTLSAWVSDYTKPIRQHVTTLSYKHLVVQILTVRPDKSVRPGTVLKPKPGPWPKATRRIFPVVPLAIWPPMFSIDHQVTRDDFLDRWNRHRPGELIRL